MLGWFRRFFVPRPAQPLHLFGAGVQGAGLITQSAALTVGTTPTLLLAANGIRRLAVLTNTGAGTVSLGNASIVAGQGIQLTAGAAWVDDTSYGAWYGIVASGTGSVAPLEVA